MKAVSEVLATSRAQGSQMNHEGQRGRFSCPDKQREGQGGHATKANKSHLRFLVVKPCYRLGGSGDDTRSLEAPDNSREAATVPSGTKAAGSLLNTP